MTTLTATMRGPAVRTVGACLAGILALTACGDNAGSNGTGPAPGFGDLDGRTFISTGVTDDGEPYRLAKGSTLTLTFTDDGIGASAGCNSMGGSASIANGVLVIDGGLWSTEMACSRKLMEQEQWYADLLTSRPTLALDGDQLTFTSGTVVITMLDREIVEPDAELTGTSWTLDAIVEGESVSSVPAGVTSTLLFKADGTLVVSPGCNSGSGSYTADDRTINVGPIATTLMGCEEPQAGVEAAVLTVLRDEVDYTIDAGTLSLTRGDQGLVYRAD